MHRENSGPQTTKKSGAEGNHTIEIAHFALWTVNANGGDWMRAGVGVMAKTKQFTKGDRLRGEHAWESFRSFKGK